ncbi:MAG: tape measure protein [Zoogloeaceae bacterium]|jgi:tape measure domain-containing protein|nr:tape measure protein [Zoogloeaceae bacterium]
MAGRLGLDIRITADGRSASRELEQLIRNLRGGGDAARDATREFGGLTSAVGRYAAAAAGFMSVGKLTRLADEWGQVSSRIEIAAGSSEAAAEAQARLMEVSNRSYKSFGNSAELYVRSSQSLRELGHSANDALAMVEALQYGLTVSAANGERSANVINAWSKAINQGKMRFEEFESVVNGAPRLVQALADSLGKSTVELQAMVRDGKITADMLVGVGSQVKKLGEEADKMPVTLADAFQRAENSLSKFAGSAEANTGVIKTLTTGITALSDNLDIVAAVAGTVVVAAFARMVAATQAKISATIADHRATQAAIIGAREAAVTEAQLALSRARSAVAAAAATGNSTVLANARRIEALRVQELTVSTNALTAAQRGSSLASAGAGAAMAALGGPLGLLVIGLGAAAMAWSVYSSRAQDAARATAEAQRQMEIEQKLLAGQSRQQIANDEEITRRKQALVKAEAELEKTRAGIDARRARGDTSARDEAYYAKALADRQKSIDEARANLERGEQLAERAMNGGITAAAAGNARYRTYINERRSLAEQLKADLETESDAFASATKNLQKDSTEYMTALEAYNRKVTELRRQYAKKEKAGQPKAPRKRKQKEKTFDQLMDDDPEVSLQRETARSYAQAMERLIGVESAAAREAANLTQSQGVLLDVMTSAQWANMPEPWRALIEAQAQTAQTAETSGEYARFLSDMDTLNHDATKSTMDLDEAMSRLYDLMLSPAWQQMTDAQRMGAAAMAESASNAQKQAADKANRMGFSDMRNDLSRSISQGLVDGFSNGGNLVEGFADGLRNALNNYAQKGLEQGISKALDIASNWIAELFSSMASSSSASGGSSGWGAIFSSIASWLASARGNAFDNGVVQRFAAGGAFGRGEVLTRPTMFRFASGGAWRNGVAGEAGPEAALPLKRMPDGQLGVYADGGGGGAVNISIVVNADGGRDESQGGDSARDYAALSRNLEAAALSVVQREMRPGGILAGVRT